MYAKCSRFISILFQIILTSLCFSCALSRFLWNIGWCYCKSMYQNCLISTYLSTYCLSTVVEFCIVVYRLCKIYSFKVSNNFDSTNDFLRSSIAIPAGRLYINVAAAVVAVADFLLWLPPASPELKAVGSRGQGVILSPIFWQEYK